MQRGKIRTKDKYFECMHDLHEFGYVDYQRGSRYTTTSVSIIPDLRNLVNRIPDLRNDENNQILEIKNLDKNQIPDLRNLDNQIPEIKNFEESIIPDLRNDEMNKMPDYEANDLQIPEIKKDEKLKSQVHSTVSTITNKNNKIDIPVVQDGGVEETKTSSPSPISRRGGRGVRLTDHAFTESELCDPQKFKEAFQDHERWNQVDFEYYREKVLNWRDAKTGLPPKRTDWKATIIQFFLNDYREQKLVTLITHATTKSTNLKPLGLAPYPKSGREFGTW